MFDPTVYENLKVVVEGSIYDLDLAGSILVMNRIDRVELATMSRYYSLSFAERELGEGSSTVAEIRLVASTQDLSAEILQAPDVTPGCHMEVIFHTWLTDPTAQCPGIEEIIHQIWLGRPHLKQLLSFEYGKTPVQYKNQIVLDFGRKIDEGQIDDLPGLIDHMLHTVQTLNQLKRQE